MIAQAATTERRARFLKACRGAPALGALMAVDFELFGKAMPGRFYSGPTAAIDTGGRTAKIAGHANPEELAGFLGFCGCGAVILDEAHCPPPTGWRKAETLTVFSLAKGEALPLPPVDAALWASLTLDREPAAGAVARFLFGAQGSAQRDDFYSELCTKRAHGKGFVWALRQNGQIVCTVGAYALYGGQGYMACGKTAEELRGRSIGGRLIVQMANGLAAEGLRPVFMCSPERVRFYTRLGFANSGELARYERAE